MLPPGTRDFSPDGMRALDWIRTSTADHLKVVPPAVGLRGRGVHDFRRSPPPAWNIGAELRRGPLRSSQKGYLRAAGHGRPQTPTRPSTSLRLRTGSNRRAPGFNRLLSQLSYRDSRHTMLQGYASPVSRINECGEAVPRGELHRGLEPRTCRLRNGCSAS